MADPVSTIVGYDGPCHDPQCGDSTWDHDCPTPPLPAGHVYRVRGGATVIEAEGPSIVRHMFKRNGNLAECGYVEAGPGRRCGERKDHEVHTPSGTSRESWLTGKAQALGRTTRDAARTILDRCLDDDTRAVVVEALHELVDEQQRWKDAWAHTTVNADRQLIDAMARSESCEHHGEQIRQLSAQVHHFSEAHRRADEGRVSLVGFLHGIDESVRMYDKKVAAGEPVPDSPALFEALRRLADATRRDHDRAWKRAAS